jgi:hypothetical protein
MMQAGVGQARSGHRIIESGRKRFEAFSFGTIRIDGVTYEHDVVIDRGHVRKRSKKASKKYRDQFGHTPLSTLDGTALYGVEERALVMELVEGETLA